MQECNKIFVTQPSLPPLDEFIPYLKAIWETKNLTNNGAFHEQFEKALAEYLGVKYVSLFCNGMIALQIGLQALKITGEVITTPYTFAATTHAIYWNRCTPVFCDINLETFNINTDKIESLITPNTTAILPVHVYGIPCDNVRLQKICDTYGLKLFYDAAHAFGIEKDGVSVLNWGDLSMLSFHATKCFNTFEGGALITNDTKLKKRIDFLKNFGFANETTVVAPGTNGKMNEFQAAFGLLQLKYIDDEIEKAKQVAKYYRRHLANIKGIIFFDDVTGVKHNYSYFPILVDADKYGIDREELYCKFRESNIFVRRYFYPLISQFSSYKHLASAEAGKLPIADRMSKQVVCLPIYPDLSLSDVNRVIQIISDNKQV
jgi:dTDP-4-amino-4,6-dideoxygalactose transaminase